MKAVGFITESQFRYRVEHDTVHRSQVHIEEREDAEIGFWIEENGSLLTFTLDQAEAVIESIQIIIDRYREEDANVQASQ